MPRGVPNGPRKPKESPSDLSGMLKAIEAIDRKISRVQSTIGAMLDERAKLRTGIDVELTKRDKQFSTHAPAASAHVAPSRIESPETSDWTAQRLRRLMHATGLDAKAIAAKCETDPVVVNAWATGNGLFYPLKNSLAILTALEAGAA